MNIFKHHKHHKHPKKLLQKCSNFFIHYFFLKLLVFDFIFLDLFLVLLLVLRYFNPPFLKGLVNNSWVVLTNLTLALKLDNLPL
jgi:hypothetical protein